MERPAEGRGGRVYRISDLELASRLSFFLGAASRTTSCSTLPCRAGSATGSAREAGAADARRLALAQPRENFAGQWLWLRNIDAVNPNAALYRDFDDNLRQAFRQETELFFDSVLREDRSVLTFIRADYTFLTNGWRSTTAFPRVRQPVPPGDALARQPSWRPAAPGQRAVGHAVRDPYIADSARRPRAEQLFGAAASPAAARCPGPRREQRGRQPSDAPAPGRPSHQCRLRELSPQHRPGGLLARELQRDWPVARDGGRRATRRLVGRPARRHGAPGVDGLEDGLLAVPSCLPAP